MLRAILSNHTLKQLSTFLKQETAPPHLRQEFGEAKGTAFFPLSDEIFKLFTSATGEVEATAARGRQLAAGAKQLAIAMSE